MGAINWTYTTSEFGGGTVTFVTSDTPTSGTQYQVIGVSGTYNGSNINSLGATGTSFYGTTVNNMLDSTASSSYGYIGDNGGVSFTTADGNFYSFTHEPSSFDPMMMHLNPDTFWVAQGSPISGISSDTPTSASFASAACFTPGTLISTPTGSTPVQDIQIGDLILNHLGQAVPVKWIGRQQIHPAFAGDKLPICIRQGALGNDLPLRDLYVSPGHALYIDNCLLIDAKALVNGTTITQVTQWEGDVEYFHIETEHHEIILAEGPPAETFMDNVSRTCFNNYSEYASLYPQATEMIELEIPRVSHQRQLPNVVKNKLEAIAEVLMESHGVKEQRVG